MNKKRGRKLSIEHDFYMDTSVAEACNNSSSDVEVTKCFQMVMFLGFPKSQLAWAGDRESSLGCDHWGLHWGLQN